MDDPKNELNVIDVDCYCECGSISISQDKEDKDFGVVSISYYIRAWNVVSDGIWGTIKKRAKMIWFIFTGKEYYFYEIIIENKSKLSQFKEYVASLREDLLPYD